MGVGDTEFPADNDEEEWKFMHERGAWNEFAHPSLYGSARLKYDMGWLRLVGSVKL